MLGTEWYTIPLLWSPQNPAKSLHTNSHRSIITKAYDALQLALDVSLHAGRHLVSKVLQSDPLVSALDTMTHIGWSISGAFRSYMNPNSVAPLLKAARFSVDSDYRLSQLEVPVPPAVEQAVFPALDGMRVQLAANAASDQAASAFGETLTYIRRVFLAGSALLQRIYPFFGVLHVPDVGFFGAQLTLGSLLFQTR